MKKSMNFIALIILFSGIFTTSCQRTIEKDVRIAETGNLITQEQVIAVQKSWGDAIVLIGDA